MEDRQNSNNQNANIIEFDSIIVKQNETKGKHDKVQIYQKAN